MIFQNIEIVHVFYLRGLEKFPVGRLALKNREIFFEYSPSFLPTKIELSPLKLPLKPGLIRFSDMSLFEGLFGVFNDSLPDGWGRLLLDRKLTQLGVNFRDLSSLDRLSYVGSHGMGALIYEPEIAGSEPDYHKDLDEIAEEIVQFQDHEDDRFVDDLLAMNGSSAGARPKISLKDNDQDWIVKFRSSIDPKDVGPIEYIYHLLAKEAGLDVPAAKLFPARKGPGYFGVQRFDRVGNNRVHMHTLSGLLHADHRRPSLDYESIIKATLWLTKDIKEGERQFRAAVFNVLSHNRDDHAKNFSFLLSNKNQWQVSPAYDLTFSSGPNGEHCSLFCGEGKNPTLAHFLKLAEVGGIKKQKAFQIIDEVRSAVSKWEVYAKNFDVSAASRKMISVALERVEKAAFIK